MKTILLILTMFAGVNANAQLLSSPSFTKQYALYGIPVAESVDYNTISLKLTSTGIAGKKVGVARAKVFIAQVYTQYPEKFVRTETGVVKSIVDVGYTSIRLTFIRGVDSVMISDAISEYLTLNITQAEYPRYKLDIDTIISAIKGDESFLYGSSITIVAHKGNLLYEDTSGKVTMINSQNQDLTTRIFAMFLGEVSNNDGYILKMHLLANPVDTFGALK